MKTRSMVAVAAVAAFVAGSTYIASPVASYNCNGTGTKTYRGKRWARSTDNSERTTYSGGAALTC